jgi:hypothetical protein
LEFIFSRENLAEFPSDLSDLDRALEEDSDLEFEVQHEPSLGDDELVAYTNELEMNRETSTVM